MPFTLAHPAAVIPLRRVFGRVGVFSALVIGSMTPDFAYWLPWTISRGASHSVPALFWFCVPAGLLGYGVFHGILKRPAVSLMPRAVQVRLPPLAPWQARDVPLLRVCMALLLGAMTHILWDAFTHEDGAAVRLFPLLAMDVLTYGRHTLRLYKLLQHGSTLVGLGVLAVWVWSWFQGTAPRSAVWVPQLKPVHKVVLYACLGAPAALAMVVYGMLAAPIDMSLAYIQAAVVAGVIAGIGAFAVVLMLLGIVWPFLVAKFFLDGAQ